jgi:membrane fusion protein (multidrug efflux system)
LKAVKITQGTCLVAMLVIAGCGEQKAPSAAPAPPTVYVQTVEPKDVSLYFEAVGSLDGYDNADIRARVRGFLESQNYKDGAPVKKGDLLFTIESTEYAAAITSAKAALDRAKVARDRNRIQLDRDKGLLQSGMISQQDLDNATASVADAEGQVLAAQAQTQTAELNLSYTRIHAPLDGVAGLALVRIGNLVGQDGPTLLTTVSQLDPIRLNFPIGEIEYLKFPERYRKLANHDLAWVKTQLAALDAGGLAENSDPGVEIVLADGTMYPHRGVIVTANRQIDASTGTIQIQALAANPDGALRPGQYARARVRRAQEGGGVLVVPQRALIDVQGNYSVAIVGADGKVQMRRVQLGAVDKDSQIIDKGLSSGDRVVVDGIQKVSDGALVNAQPAPDVPSASVAAARKN